MIEYTNDLEQRQELQLALRELHGRGISDQQIYDTLCNHAEDGRVSGFSKTKPPIVSRPTIQRYRTATDIDLQSFRHQHAMPIYNFLCQCEEFPNQLYKTHARIRSAHKLAPFLQSFLQQFGARRSQLAFEDLKSLQGTFHLYRKSWTSFKPETYIQSILTFVWVGEALFYTEEQNYFDTTEDLPVKEYDEGLVIPFGINVILLGHGKSTDLVKFFSIHDFIPFPDGKQRVQQLSGNFIAVYSKGPHPGYQAFAQRVKPQLAKSKFWDAGKLDARIVKRLSGKVEPKFLD